LTTKEVADQYGFTRQTIGILRECGMLHGYQAGKGGGWHYTSQELDRFSERFLEQGFDLTTPEKIRTVAQIVMTEERRKKK